MLASLEFQAILLITNPFFFIRAARRPSFLFAWGSEVVCFHTILRPKRRLSGLSSIEFRAGKSIPKDQQKKLASTSSKSISASKSVAGRYMIELAKSEAGGNARRRSWLSFPRGWSFVRSTRQSHKRKVGLLESEDGTCLFLFGLSSLLADRLPKETNAGELKTP